MSEHISTQSQEFKETKLLVGRERILIIGAGFSGTVTAMRLLQNATKPLDVVLMERIEEQRDGGLAYSSSTVGWEHLLNIQAGRITAFREDPDDFMDWANIEANRDSWPSQWQNTKFEVSSPVPRRTYQQYLHDRLNQAIANAASGVALTRLQGEAVDLVQTDTTTRVLYLEPGSTERREVAAEQTIIATGHVDFVQPPFVEEVKEAPNFILDQFSQKGQVTIQNLGKHETVFIVGTGLTAYDAVISLLNKGHEGRIILSSRNGNTHFVYPEGHEHEILRVRRPAALDMEELTTGQVVNSMVEEFKYLCEQFKQERPEMPVQVYAERILKAWEPYIAELIQRLPAEDIQQLIARYKSLIVTSRIGTIPEIGNRVVESMKPKGNEPPQVEILRGDIQKMTTSEDSSHIIVTMTERGKQELTVIQAGVVIASIGQESDYTKVTSQLWRTLVERQEVIPHKKTRRGIEVGAHGELIDAHNQPSKRVYAVGPMRQGDEMQRRGRLGAFVFSIGTSRNQAFETAVDVLTNLEDKRVQSEGMPELHLTADSIHVSDLIAQVVIQRNQANISSSAVEDIKTIVDVALAPSFIREQEIVLTSRNPIYIQAFEAKVALIEDQMRETLQSIGLESEIIKDIIRETTKHRQRVALRKLTDIAYLADRGRLRLL